MKWDNFKSKLKLNKTQAKKIEAILVSFKKQYAELCLLKAVESRKSPVEYVAELKAQQPQLDNDIGSRDFVDFLSNERIPFADLTYIEAKRHYDLITRAKIHDLLKAGQKEIYQTLKIESMLDIDIGYDPFAANLKKEIIKYQKSQRPKDIKLLSSKTFCILPWVHFFVEASSEVKLCCFSSKGLTGENGSPLSLKSMSLRDIWNSTAMKEVRRKMLAGENIGACSKCDRESELDQTSGREYYNNLWLVNDREHKKWKLRVEKSIKNNLEVSGFPVYYDLRPGNTCNLKCRMCNADYSCLVRDDLVHSKWAHRSPDIEGTRFPDGSKWYETDDVFLNEIMENIKDARMFYLSGGEPLINPFTTKLIDLLIKRKVAHKIALQLSSNLTVYPDDIFAKLNNFESVLFYISIDGIGPAYEYIRYPAKWKIVERNMKKISKNPGVSCVITPTVQNYNVLFLTDILEFAGSLGIPCNFNILYAPHFLSVRAMPGKARILAITRLLEYLDEPSHVKQFPDMVSSINDVIMELKQNTQKPYPDTIMEFIMFTNELDASRNQNISEALPDLYNYIIEDGFKWIAEKHDELPSEQTPSGLSLEGRGSESSISWNVFRKKLKLTKARSEKIKEIINRGKDHFTEICLRLTTDKDKSPVQFTADMKMIKEPLDQEEFLKYYTCYLAEKSDAVSKRTYLESGEIIDKSIRAEIRKLLSKDGKKALDDLSVGPFLYIDTGYDPLGEKVSELITLISSNLASYVKLSVLLKELNAGKSKSLKIKKIINSGKEQFTETCLSPTSDKEKSPVQFAADLKMSKYSLEPDEFKKFLAAYLSGKKDSVSNLTYIESFERIDRAVRKEIFQLLNEKERETLRNLDVVIFLYIDTGYEPLEDKITEQIKSIQISRIAGIKEKKYKKLFCPMPFEYVSVCDNGDVYLCSACKMRSSVGNLGKNSLEELWNSDLAIKVREAVLDGSYKFCNESECEYLQDRKLRKKSAFTGKFYKKIIANKITSMKTGPRTIEVSYDKSCNLSCHYCRREHLVCKGNELKRLRSIHNSVLKNHLQGVGRLMISGCGDPLASRLHRDFLRKLDQRLFPDIRIKLQTNGLLLTPEMWESLSSSHYAIDWISTSIDAATEETYKMNRGGNFRKLIKNLEFVSKLRKDNIIDAFNINFVVQANNFREMKQFVELGKRLGCDYINFQKIMNLGIDYGLYSEEEYRKVAVHLESHPDHGEFLDLLNDPVFLDQRIGLFKLLEYFPENIRAKKNVDSIVKFYPESERHLGEN